MGAQLEYDDGLDADGFPVSSAAGLRFKPGSEEEAGTFAPLKLVDAAALAVERICRFREIGGNCDSPIEDMLGAALLVFFDRAGEPLSLCKMIDLEKRHDGLLLIPQFSWSYYRSDWAIVSQRTGLALLVECDGKDFHSSDEQRAHDARKDAAALDRGFLTLRFTGSQINRDADGCAQKVYDVVMGA